MAKKIKMVLIERDMTLKELAVKLNTTSGNLSSKLTRDNLSEKEIVKIANALNCEYEAGLILRDTGKRI